MYVTDPGEHFQIKWGGDYFNPIPTGQGRNQLLYERHVTKSGRNRVTVQLSAKGKGPSINYVIFVGGGG